MAECRVVTYERLREIYTDGAMKQAASLVEKGTPEAYTMLHGLARHFLRRAQREYDTAWGVTWETISDIYWEALDTSPGRMS